MAITSDNSIGVGWIVPDIVFAQHTIGDTYTVTVTPACRNGQNTGIDTPSPVTLDYDGDRTVEIMGLRMFSGMTACIEFVVSVHFQ